VFMWEARSDVVWLTFLNVRAHQNHNYVFQLTKNNEKTLVSVVTAGDGSGSVTSQGVEIRAHIVLAHAVQEEE
jgi:hypothetical protein